MTAARTPTATSERTADEGCVLVAGTDRDFPLAETRAWREGDVYVLKSVEFDVLAEDEDFNEAVDIFISRLLDYASMLRELVDAKTATDDEVDEFAALAVRFFPLIQAVHEDENAKRAQRPRSRRRGSGSGHWQHRGTPASGSALPSVA